MVRSMYSGVSGLRVHQTKMDVIGNNIANVNTAGYKASIAIFEDTFCQNTATTTAPSEDGTMGGKDAMQIGLGAAVAAINIKTKASSAQSTERALDVALTGDGYFALEDPTNEGATVYTRSGNFKLDANGDLVHAGTGYYVLDSEGARITGLTAEHTNIAIDQQGHVKGLNREGVEEIIEGHILQVANFRNNEGLLKIGKSLYQESSNSGEVIADEALVAGNNGTGDMLPGYLEMSNVDLATEFTEMITTQRGYQANSRVITVSDTMLEELINLKR